MNPTKWELTSDLGFTFEFTYKSDQNVTLTLIANSEKEAWAKIKSLS